MTLLFIIPFGSRTHNNNNNVLYIVYYIRESLVLELHDIGDETVRHQRHGSLDVQVMTVHQFQHGPDGQSPLFVDYVVSSEVIEELEHHLRSLEGRHYLQDVLVDVLERVKEEQTHSQFVILFGNMQIVVDNLFLLLFEPEGETDYALVAGLVVLGEEGVEVTLDGGQQFLEVHAGGVVVHDHLEAVLALTLFYDRPVVLFYLVETLLQQLEGLLEALSHREQSLHRLGSDARVVVLQEVRQVLVIEGSEQ